MNNLSLRPFSLNFVLGPRQAGKTTMIKLLIQKLLESVEPISVFYCSCEEAVDYRDLDKMLGEYLSLLKAEGKEGGYIFLDEITFVKDWWRAVKARIDNGDLRKSVVTVTGSASVELLSQREYFPGRRGNGKDVLVLPLSFSSYTSLWITELEKGGIEGIKDRMERNKIFREEIVDLFHKYIELGGFPRAIESREEALNSLWYYIKGDTERLRKSVRALEEVASVILRAHCSPLSWNTIKKNTSLRSPNTARDYVETMEKMFLLTVLPYQSPERIIWRKERKIHFSDPLLWWLFSERTGIEVDIPCLVEGTVASHLSRLGRVGYWRNGTEVDVILDGRIGVEVKWALKSGRKPRFLKEYITLNRDDVPLFLASLDV